MIIFKRHLNTAFVEVFRPKYYIKYLFRNCKEARCTSYSIAIYISIHLPPELSNHTCFQLSQSVCIFRCDVAHFAKFLPLDVIFLFAHILLKLLKLPSFTCPSNFPSVPALNMVQPANSVIRSIVSKPIPLDSPGKIPRKSLQY